MWSSVNLTSKGVSHGKLDDLYVSDRRHAIRSKQSARVLIDTPKLFVWSEPAMGTCIYIHESLLR